MKTKLMLFLGLLALVTLSFTFSTVNNVEQVEQQTASKMANSAPVGGLFADEVVE